MTQQSDLPADLQVLLDTAAAACAAALAEVTELRRRVEAFVAADDAYTGPRLNDPPRSV